KLHEEFVRGPLSAVCDRSASGLKPLKGEVSLVVEGAAPAARAASAGDLDTEIRAALAAGQRVRELAPALARRLGRSRREAYQRALPLERGGSGREHIGDDDAGALEVRDPSLAGEYRRTDAALAGERRVDRVGSYDGHGRRERRARWPAGNRPLRVDHERPDRRAREHERGRWRIALYDGPREGLHRRAPRHGLLECGDAE